MKCLCAVVFLLSFISVCQPATVACEKFLKTAVSDQDLTGKWYVIAVSSNSCWATAVGVLPLSIHADITATEQPNRYKAKFFYKIYGQCQNHTTVFLYVNSTIFEVNSKGVKVGEQGLLLERRCHDCLTFRTDGFVDILGLLSRRTSITAEEMEAFEIQADCRGLYKPQTFNSDHDYDSCTSFQNDRTEVSSSESLQFQQALGNVFSQLFTCFTDRVFYYPRAAYQWMQQTWDNWW